ncbi:SET domain protein 16 isoform 1 [Hibiscus syriacus]|uniref:SET domain protein 16 isoform 1 n=1 Tax=Hibiscus syriacus TaxID=106335 RepID=A0A6A2Z841_HIBSY|nr:SET domain protein 16 isoform 1 [Hibiscus syriacus]
MTIEEDTENCESRAVDSLAHVNPRHQRQKLDVCNEKSDDHGDLKGSQHNARQPQSVCMQENVAFNFNENAGMKRKQPFNEKDGEDEWEGGLKPKPKRSKKGQPLRPMSTPDLPDDFKRQIFENMGGSGLILAIQKTLFYSDVNPTASRFSVPFSQLRTHDFLTETEAQQLAGKNPMEVRLLDPYMEETTLSFNRWEMGKNKLYAMTTAWNSVVMNNRLVNGNIVQLWSFRVSSELCFALVKVDV